MSEFNVWGYIARLGTRVLGPGDSTLRPGDEVCAVEEPIFLVLEDVEEFLHQEYPEFQCNAPGCMQTFRQVYESEAHYRSVHSFSCSVCRKSLPSNHLLELHVQEAHDSFFSVLAEKQASYQCFLPTCTSKFWSPEERREHAISSHDFPADFRFDNNAGTGGQKGKKQGGGGKNKKQKQKQRSASMKEVRSEADSMMEVEDREKTDKHLDVEGQKKHQGKDVEKTREPGSNVKEDGNSEKCANNNENTMEVDGETVVLRRNRNDSGAGGKSAGTARRPISLARLPSPKLNTPQILNRPSSSVSGRRNTISSSSRESNGNSMSSPRSAMDTSSSANIPGLSLDSEGNTRGRRSTVSSSPRESVEANTRGRRSTISTSSRDSVCVDTEGNTRGRRSTISTSSRDSVYLDMEGNNRSRRNTLSSTTSKSSVKSPRNSVGSSTSPRGYCGSSTTSTSPRNNNSSSTPRVGNQRASSNSSTPRGNGSVTATTPRGNGNSTPRGNGNGNTTPRGNGNTTPRGNGSGVTTPRGYVHSSTLPKNLNSSPRPFSMDSYSQDLESMSDSPRKSKIPVRSASTSKAPKQFSFGVGISKAFNRGKGKAWYQTKSQSQQNVDTSMDIETTDFSSLRDTLPS